MKVNTDIFSFGTASILILLCIAWTLILFMFVKSDCKPNDAGVCIKPSLSLFLPSIATFGLAMFLLFKK
jgi:O-antigen ligase